MAAEKRKLPNVTLAAMTSVNIWATIKAMEYSMRGIAFGDAVLITHKKPFGLPKCIRYSHTDKLNNIDDFNYKMVYELGSHIHTEFVLIVHADGFVVHPELWRDEFLDYDYIGAMEYGMPPISGWGMGIDRLMQLLTNSENIKDCILFPLMKPLN